MAGVEKTKTVKEPLPGLLTEHKGRKRYSLWFVDMDGKEDFFTIMMTFPQAVELYRAFDGRKHLITEQTVSDFVLRVDTPYTYPEALEYIAERMEDLDSNDDELTCETCGRTTDASAGGLTTEEKYFSETACGKTLCDWCKEVHQQDCEMCSDEEAA